MHILPLLFSIHTEQVRRKYVYIGIDNRSQKYKILIYADYTSLITDNSDSRHQQAVYNTFQHLFYFTYIGTFKYQVGFKKRIENLSFIKPLKMIFFAI